MKTILCYGDSNTWGYDPATKGRFPRSVRWTGVLQQELGSDFYVIEEGLNGRTTVFDDPIEGLYKNGKTYLTPCLESQQPLNLVILMLGTNDLKARFAVPPSDIARGMEALVQIVKQSAAGPDDGLPQILVVSPLHIGKLSEFKEMFEGAPTKSKQLAQHYELVAQTYGCHFLDAAGIISPSDLDGVHFEADEHHKLGLAMARTVRSIV